ncbi:BLOC-1-related complex subunit 7-like [Carassius auratus]|uniref:BLOC-1-related complex subunit 7 n=1 Tax=Carassius auratus TaxID=7957 RepID=A0A6P6QPB1_CARAU|nr:BLOC-1-related complex subunit 7-like [Carassius auratus]XP_052468920.1 BLOC-1-related complex subunit 7-like [Carassius gibelio]
MASSETQPRFGQSVKGLLSDKVTSCSGDVIALTRQMLKGSRSQELLSQAARNMVIQEDAILHSEDSLRKMSIITTHLQYQQEAIEKNVEHSRTLQDQLKHLMR